MTTETGKAVAIREGLAVTAPETQKREEFSTALMVTQETIDRTKHSLVLFQQLVNDVLVEGRDYGSTPGIPDEYLWDTGASLIISSFNSRPGQTRVIKEVADGKIILVVLEVPIISYITDKEVGCGLGAASTLETKHKYRWLREYELADWGFGQPEVKKTLKTRVKWGKMEYRIPNLEHDDLLNTIWKIAAKRARIAAAKNLPGVSSALAEKLKKRGQQEGQGEGEGKKRNRTWGDFWAQMRQRGLEHDAVCELINVKSLRDYINSGKTVEDAIKAVDAALGARARPAQVATAPAAALIGTEPAATTAQPAEPVKAAVPPVDVVHGVNIQATEVLMSDIGWGAKDLPGAVKYLKIPVSVRGTTAEVFRALSPDQAKQLFTYIQGLADRKAVKREKLL